jgi:putative hydrolase of the HAD superfamily
MFKNIKAIVFDLDDTLYLQRDYKQSGFTAVAEWLEKKQNIKVAVSLDKLESIINEHGPSYPFIFDRLLEKLALPQSLVPLLVDVFLDADLQLSCFPDVKKILSQLKHRFKLGLLTDGRENIQRKKVRCLGVENFFDHILYSASLGLEKPSPELYQFFEMEFSLSGKEIVYVGDNPNKDFVEAKRRSWRTIRILTGEYKTLSFPKHLEADICLLNFPLLQNVFKPNISIQNIEGLC